MLVVRLLAFPVAYHPTADNKIAGSLMTKDGEQMDIKAEHLLGWTVLPLFEGSVVPGLCLDLYFSCENVLCLVSGLWICPSLVRDVLGHYQQSVCCAWICPSLVRDVLCLYHWSVYCV